MRNLIILVLCRLRTLMMMTHSATWKLESRCCALIPASQSSFSKDHHWGSSRDGQHRRPAESYVPSVWTLIRTASQLPQVDEAHIPVHTTGTPHPGPQWTKTQVTNIEKLACNLKKCGQIDSKKPWLLFFCSHPLNIYQYMYIWGHHKEHKEYINVDVEYST